MPERQEEKVDDEKEKEVVTGDEIEKRIGLLLKLAYQELRNKNSEYMGHPMSDHIACFLDLKVVLEDKKFQEVFNRAIPDYKDNWEEFEAKIIKPKLDAILDILNNIKNLKGTSDTSDSINFLRNSKFDLFSNSVAICNMSIASALYTICTYASINKSWIKSDESGNKLKKVIALLNDTRISGGGWQYALVEKKEMYVHTLSTWLSLVSLGNIPEKIMTEDLRKEIETIKRDTINWLKDKVDIDENGYCSWCFRPDEINSEDYGDNSPNVVATAQAILALYFAGIDINDEIIKCSIDFVKSKKKIAKSPTSDIIPEARIDQKYQGIQHCLQALLLYNVPPEDESVQYLLKKTIDIVDTLFKKKNKAIFDKYSYYTTLVPLLWYLIPSAKPVVKPVSKTLSLTSSNFKSEFKSFVSDAKSIVLVGEIDDIYVGSMPLSADITIFYQPKFEHFLQQRFPHWKRYEIDWKFENINCVIVNGKAGLISSNPFKATGHYSIITRLGEEEALNLINKLEEITGVKIESPKEEIKEIIGEKFPEQSESMALKNLESNQLNGILEYYKLNPEYSEAVPSSLGFTASSREDIESQLTNRGLISRVFMNSELEGLIKNEIKDDNLVMDESSAYLLLKSTKKENDVNSLLSHTTGDLYMLIDVRDRLEGLNLPQAEGGRLQKIPDQSIDAEIEFGYYHLTENEKIVISFTKKSKDSKYGIITNRWEVAKMCMKLGINVYSLMKFLNKDEETYKIFRIPVDLLEEM